jgi:hypothetical protein
VVAKKLQREITLMDSMPIEVILDHLKIMYDEKMPFNKYLGLKIDSLSIDSVVVRIDMRKN